MKMINSLKHILSLVSKADYEFSLIDDGDKIAVGVSGGKDSMLMLKALKLYSLFPNKNFTFYAVFLDLGFGNVDQETLKTFCEKENIPLHIENSTDVYQILKCHKNKNGHLPCSICSRMKKAAINKVAHELNCNKVTFAHHYDDALETLLMNSIYGGRLATFAPKMHLETTDLTFIRPFILVREKYIISAVKANQIPVIKSACPNDHITMREEAKQMLSSLYQKYPESYQNYFNLLLDDEHFDLWFDKKMFPLGNHLTAIKARTQEDILACYYLFKSVVDENSLNQNTLLYLVRKEGNPYLACEIRKIAEKEYLITKVSSECLDMQNLLSYIEYDLAKKSNPLIFHLSDNLNDDFFERNGYDKITKTKVINYVMRYRPSLNK